MTGYALGEKLFQQDELPKLNAKVNDKGGNEERRKLGCN